MQNKAIYYAMLFCLTAIVSPIYSVESDLENAPVLEKVATGQKLFAERYSEVLSLLDKVMVRNEKSAMTGYSHRARVLGKLNQIKNGYVAVRYSTIPMIPYDKTKVGNNDYYQIKTSVVELFDLQPPRRADLFRVDPIEFELVPTIHTERLFVGGTVVFQDGISMANYKTRLDLGAEVIGFIRELKSLYKLWFESNSNAIVIEQDKTDIMEAIAILEQIKSVFALSL